MKYFSVCSTDIKVIHGLMRTAKFPIVLGHEGVGEVAEVGSSVSSVAAGDMVLLDPNLYDLVCDRCRAGNFNMCEKGGLMGRDTDGLFREEIVVDEQRLYRLPKGLDLTSAPLLQPLSTAVRAIKKIKFGVGDTMLVVGLGPMGLMFCTLGKIYGATVIATTRSENKLRLAAEMGATHTFKSSGPDELEKSVKAITGNKGLSIVVDTTGDPLTAQRCAGLLRPGGQFVEFANVVTTLPLDLYSSYLRELVYVFSRSSIPADFKDAIELYSNGKIALQKLVSKVYAFEELGRAVADFESGKILKPVIKL